MTSQTSRETAHSPDGGFPHAVLITESDEGLRARLMPVLWQCFDEKLPVLMVVSPHTERLVRAELGGRSDRLQWGQPDAFYQRLGFAFEEFRRFLAYQHASGRSVHVIAEPDLDTGPGPDGPVDRAAAYLAYEAVCNQVYAGYGCPVTCVWDSRRHPTLVIENVRSLHNREVTEAGSVINARYVAPVDYLAGRSGVPLPSTPTATDLDVGLTDLDALDLLRGAVESWAGQRSFSPAAADDVVIAVGEVVTNGLVHGAAPIRIRGWHVADTLVVQIDDAGGRPIPPTAGYLPPTTRQEGGRGLWLARQLADVVTMSTGDGLTSVRMHFPRGVTHR